VAVDNVAAKYRAEVERLRNALTSAASSIHDSHRQSPEETIETCRTIICENNWAALQGERVG
jgi:hypothetical protein